MRPIRPMLHKFNYQPIEQPLLAKDVVRFVGEPIAAVIAPSSAEAEDLAERVNVEIAELPSVVDARDALRPDAPLVHGHCASNVVVETRFATPDFAAAMASAHRLVRVELRSRRQNASPLEARAAHAAFDPASGRIDADLRHADAASAAHRDRRHPWPSRSRPARGGAGCGRRLRAKNVAAGRIRGAGLAGASAAQHGRLERGSAREFDRGLPQPRSARARSKALSTRAESSSRYRPIFWPMSAPIRAFPPPAAWSR